MKAALHFTCSVCHRLQIPRPVAPARLCEHWKEFADCVAIDLFELTDVHGTRATFINCLDMASRFQIVARVQSKHPPTVFQAFMHHWCMWAGPPVTILTDLGGEFCREFSSELELMNTRVCHTAGVAPTQNAPAELAAGLWNSTRDA